MERDQKKPMIFGFCHVYAINNWKGIINEQFSKIKSSSLWSKMDKLFVGLIGDNKDAKVFDAFNDKVEIIYCSNKSDLYEALTLSFLHIVCKLFDGYVFYIHTKGVTRAKLCFTDWRHLMEYFVIIQHQICLQELKNNDVVGVNWHLGEGYMGASSSKAEGTLVTPHFSGNFWWAKSEYIRKLPPLYPLDSKYECEFWVGKENPKVAELWNSGIHHHRNPYLSNNYEGMLNRKYYG